MKEIRVKNTVYVINTEDEMIDLVHELAREGYTVKEIAQILSIGKRKIVKMLQDCWG